MKNGLLKLGLLGLFSASFSFASVNWEVAVVFLGSKLSPDYQADIDRNIIDLSRSNPNDSFRLSIFREFENRTVTYYVDSKSPKLQSWMPLFFSPKMTDIQVAGEFIVEPRTREEPSILNRKVKLADYFQRAFQEPNAKRILLLYDHGQAFDGLGSGVSLFELKDALVETLPIRSGKPLDILWMDACYMSNIETLYELKNISKIIIGSEEAEFSAGAPMEMFKSLSYGPRDTVRAAVDFAERFIESYSYILKGRKQKAVFTSSATISVIDTALLAKLVGAIKKLKAAIGKFSSFQIQSIRSADQTLTMERKDLLDLGSLIQLMSRSKYFNRDLNIREAVFELATILDIGKPSQTRTNPRLILDPKFLRSHSFVFGYNQWTSGDENDKDILEKVPPILMESISFVSGPFSKMWPKRHLDKLLYFSPFSVGLNIFNYYAVNPNSNKPVSAVNSLVRVRDFVLETRESKTNPILLSGYTEGIGSNAERYSGISIVDPTIGLPSFDYTDLEFFKETRWTEN